MSRVGEELNLKNSPSKKRSWSEIVSVLYKQIPRNSSVRYRNRNSIRSVWNCREKPDIQNIAAIYFSRGRKRYRNQIIGYSHALCPYCFWIITTAFAHYVTSKKMGDFSPSSTPTRAESVTIKGIARKQAYAPKPNPFPQLQKGLAPALYIMPFG